jgi:hypothetical protein
MGAVGVKLIAASMAPVRGECCSSARRLGGNVYLPRDRALGVTPGERHVPLSATPWHISTLAVRELSGNMGNRDSLAQGSAVVASETMPS